MQRNRTKEMTILAMFMALQVILIVLNEILASVWPFPIQPTILMVPVIVLSIVLGPKMGGFLGLWWGILSVIVATVTPGPVNFIFTPFVPVLGTNHGDWRALLVSIVPRIIVGIAPYFIYQLFGRKKISKLGLVVTGVAGSVINTIFVLSAIFLFFAAELHWTLATLLASIVATNSILEAVLSGFLVGAITPALFKLRK